MGIETSGSARLPATHNAAFSDESDVARGRVREDSIGSHPVKAEHHLEQAAEECAIFVQHRPVAILVERAAFDGDLVAYDATAAYGAAEDPVHRAMTMVGAARAVLAEGPPKL